MTATSGQAAQPGDWKRLFVATTLIGLLIASNWYWLEMQEGDSYAEALGMVTGAVSGLKSAGPNHYLISAGYGFPRLLYLIGASFDLTRRDDVVLLMNSVGHISSIAVIPLLWLVLRRLYGHLAAWTGLLLFVLSPVFLEASASAHQILIATALLLSGFLLLVEGQARNDRVAAIIASAFVLFLALTMRLEAAFAFPWVVLAHVGEPDTRTIFQRFIVRLGVCISAIAMFLVARSVLLGSTVTSQQANSFSDFYQLSNAPKGFIVSILAVGPFTVIALGVVIVANLSRPLSQDALLRRGISLAGPAALLIISIVLWILNPIPARHFLYFTLASAILISILGSWIASVRDRTIIIAALAVAIANQAAADALAPTLRRLNPARTAEPQPLNAGAPVGDAWRRYVKRNVYLHEETALGDQVAELRCHPWIVVVSDGGPILLLSQYRGRPPAKMIVSGYHSAIRDTATWPDRRVDYLYRARAQNDDIGKLVLADPAFAGAKIVIDEHARLRSDIASVPIDREPSPCT